jgi:antitoxin HigA-1
LRGDRKGQYSIRINDQFQICFVWTEKVRPQSRSSTSTRRPRWNPSSRPCVSRRQPPGIKQTDFAKRIGVTYARLNEIINGKRGVSTDTALRFSEALGTTSEVWLNIQRMTDLYAAMHSPKAKEIARIKPIEREPVNACQTTRHKRAAMEAVHTFQPNRQGRAT